MEEPAALKAKGKAKNTLPPGSGPEPARYPLSLKENPGVGWVAQIQLGKLLFLQLERVVLRRLTHRRWSKGPSCLGTGRGLGFKWQIRGC